MADTITKTCPLCYGTVDARAKKCPHCHSLLGPYRIAVPAMVIACIGALFASLVLLICAASARPPHKRDNLAANLKVITSKHYFAPSSNNGTSTVIIGSLTNTGDQPLTYMEIEAQFYNKQNELIDLFSDFQTGPIAPHEEMPIKMSEGTNIHLPEADYATHKLIIKHAYATD